MTLGVGSMPVVVVRVLLPMNEGEKGRGWEKYGRNRGGGKRGGKGGNGERIDRWGQKP